MNNRARVVYFEDDTEKFAEEAAAWRADIVYIRDPFNTGGLQLDEISPKVERIHNSHPAAYYVDQANSIEDILIEDKWRQYGIWGKWMPQTQLGGRGVSLGGQLIAKKRISARSRDILFNFNVDKLPSDWIVQERLSINEEFRVYVLFGQSVEQVSVRRSKLPGRATKVIGLRPLSAEEAKFVRKLTSEMDRFDLVGLDIALTPSGLRLIEVNRSPQLRRYNELSGDNIVVDFWHRIQERLKAA
jgi:hypothetical protein